MEKNFNLYKLLSIEDFDLKTLCIREEDLKLHEYFFRLDLLISTSIDFIKKINNTTNITNTEEYTDELEAYNKVLKKVGLLNIDELILNIMRAVQQKNFKKRREAIAKLTETINKIIINIEDKSSKSDLNYEFDIDEITLQNAIEQIKNPVKKVKYKILAVDDMPDILNSVKAILGEKYDVYALSKGEQVERFLESHIPDLFLFDIEMPGIDGYALCSLIRSNNKYKNIPVVFLTSNATVDYIKTGIDFGMSDFIKKPFTANFLLERIKNCLKD